METESPADGNPPCSALYVHIPFCHSICPFCAFAMHANRQGLHDEYLRMLDRELRAQAPAVNIPAGGLDSVYIGGGTPSTLSAGQVENLLGAIQEVCSLAGQAETAFELNPEDVKKDYVRQLVALGVNRMSLGVQSFNEGTLKTMERGHDSAQACAAMDVLAAHGPANINVDLMCGVPGQTLRQAQEDITALKRWEPAHVSLYYLDMEPGTLFRRRLDRGLFKVPDGDEAAHIMLELWNALKKQGYTQYEISNFARPGFQGRQNQLVWSGKPYLGIGCGAHSYLKPFRMRNSRHIRAYMRNIASRGQDWEFRERLSAAQLANEALMISLRLKDGLDIGNWGISHGIMDNPFRDRLLAGFVEAGKAVYQSGRFRLTPEGLAVADMVAGALMVQESEIRPASEPR